MNYSTDRPPLPNPSSFQQAVHEARFTEPPPCNAAETYHPSGERIGRGPARLAGMREESKDRGDRWLYCEPELSGSLLQPMLRFYEQQLGTNALNRLALDLDTSLDVLRDPDRWFSIACFRELYTAMARATGDQDIVYRAGRSVTRPGVMGAHRSVIRAFRSVRGVLRNWSGLDQRLRRDTDWRVSFRGRGHAVATFSLLENAEDDIELCKHRRGILESIPELFDLPPAEVLHPECIHRGDPHCRYQIRWMERPNILRIALLMTLLSSVGAIALDSQGLSLIHI